jgi:hypothetical protein
MTIKAEGADCSAPGLVLFPDSAQEAEGMELAVLLHKRIVLLAI